MFSVVARIAATQTARIFLRHRVARDGQEHRRSAVFRSRSPHVMSTAGKKAPITA
jgi:hypothetical protein